MAEKTHYTVVLWWLTGNTLESGPLSLKDGLSELRELKKHPAVKKAVLYRHVTITYPMKRFKKTRKEWNKLSVSNAKSPSILTTVVP